MPIGIDENRPAPGDGRSPPRRRRVHADHGRRQPVQLQAPLPVGVDLRRSARALRLDLDRTGRDHARRVRRQLLPPSRARHGRRDAVAAVPAGRPRQRSSASTSALPHAVFGGEVLSADYLDELRRGLGVERVHGVYASVENGSWGYCDLDRDGPRYRVVEEIVHVEVEDPDERRRRQPRRDEHDQAPLPRAPLPQRRSRPPGHASTGTSTSSSPVAAATRSASTTGRCTERDFAPVVAGAAAYQIQLSLNAERRTRVDVLRRRRRRTRRSASSSDGEQALAAVLDAWTVDRDVRFVEVRQTRQTSPTTNKTPLVVDHRQSPRM